MFKGRIVLVRGIHRKWSNHREGNYLLALQLFLPRHCGNLPNESYPALLHPFGLIGHIGRQKAHWDLGIGPWGLDSQGTLDRIIASDASAQCRR